ncbi:hypothetical protein LDENG_00021020 [Lucifuga dentata]|nr:hypothetical protein LDENG_00021020 [Lucifuga dentata]
MLDLRNGGRGGGGGGGVQAWTYNYSISPNRNWILARQWCRQHFTDMVAIQNQKEINFLNQLLPFNPTYYWIGLRKVAGVWTWVGTNNNLTPEAENWAAGEPNNMQDQQDCVEIYIKRDNDTAKWNDERCRNKKGTVCYTVSCSQYSCSTHADCVETIGNYTCQCHPGFLGPHCEQAIECKPLSDPEQGSHHCFHPYGPDHFNSSCHFQCELGFQLVGTPRLQCQANGRWNHPAPLCQVQQCPALNHTGVSMNCSHPIAPYSYNSTCEFRCHEGYKLSGQDWIQCEHTGQWTASIPACTVVQCNSLKAPLHASIRCQDPVEEYSYGSLCTVQCEEGFDLIGTNMTGCSSGGNWSHALPVCQAKRCSTLKSPAHGSLVCTDPHGAFSFSSRCTSTCEENFVLNGTDDAECTSLGTWSKELPHCLARPCPLLAIAPHHGRMNCSHPHSPFSHGSHCDFGCDKGFWLRGASTVTCTSSGHWNHDLPTCQVVQCETIQALSSHFTMNCSHPLGNFSFGSRCLFTCKAGYSLNGTEQLFCSSTGFWSSGLPTCIEEGMLVGTVMLMYAGVGGASAAVLLTLLGLVLLIMTRFKKREMMISDTSAWGARDNPAFES